MPLNLTCVLRSGTVEGSVSFVRHKQPRVQCAADFGQCHPLEPGYEVYGIDGKSAVMVITNFTTSKDAAVWTCIDGSPPPTVPGCNISIALPETNTDSPEHSGSALSPGIIAGIVIGLLLVVTISVGWILYKRKIKKEGGARQNEETNPNENEVDKPTFTNIPNTEDEMKI
ncbi:uncharacterized protein LOC121389867 [Gigantopelta aegis]|uniref:uncharacterized protein LOC121389867 n=1 Tax=Gigantopelta aegis TaxID=1735272 RepID=UPI001B88CDC9|nr:uncharacterized protein LOC121389867 [Gigantopelta aegis]XP_041377455.1 uncharacterized protein LOC121389867 [Gigantopelta aegis]